MIGKILNERYKIIKKVGTGGMAIVYLAQDQLLERNVAIKVLQPQFADNEDAIEQFTREAQAVARFSHPNIVNIFDIGQSDDIYYIVMEYITGMDLKEKIEKESRLSIREAVKIVKSVCRALIKAHQNNIIHCDIKPHNILITADNRVKVTDFGIAQAITDATMAQTDTIIGSAHYLSPEQAKGSKVTIRSDIYSLGVVLYELVTGQVPFKGENSVSVALKHIEESPKLPTQINESITDNLERIIMRAIAKEPVDRYNSVVEFLKDLKEIDAELIEETGVDDIANQKTMFLSPGERKKKIKEFKQNNDNIDSKDIDYNTEKIEEIEEIEEQSKQKRRARKSNIDKKRRKNKFEQKNKKAEEDNGADTVGLDMSKNKKSENNTKNLFKVLGILAIVSLVILGIGYYLLVGYLDVAEVEVPNLVGRDQEIAERLLERRELRLEVYHETNNNQFEAGHIISQSPEAGSKVKQNRNITVVLSKGPQLTVIPELEGKPLRDARIEINSLELFIGEQIEEYSEEYRENTIVSQQPAAGEEVKTDTPIDLVISKGPEPQATEVPELIGLQEDEVVQLLGEYNLLLGDVIERDSLQYRQGQVIEQNPEAGVEIKEGSTVGLVVSEGIRNPYNAEINTSTVRTYVPPGREQTVEIIVEDDNGRRVVYKENHEPQTRVEQEIITVGSATIRVYLNGNLNQERRI